MKDCCNNKDHDNQDTADFENVNLNSLVVGDYIELADGTNSQPSLRYTASTNSGLYHSSNFLGVSLSSIPVHTFDLANARETSLLQYQGPTGTNTVPAYSFQADPDTGMYRNNTNSIGFSVGSVNASSISSTGISNTVSTYGPTGMTGTPSYSFTNSTDSGVYYDTTNNAVSISSNSNKVMECNPTGTYFHTAGTLTGSILSNGFSSNTQEILIYAEGASSSQNYTSGVEAVYTSYGTSAVNKGFSAPVSGVFTLPSIGVYTISVQATFDPNANNTRQVRLGGTATKNGTRITGYPHPLAGNGTRVMTSGILYTTTTTETVSVLLFQDSGSTLGGSVSFALARIF